MLVSLVALSPVTARAQAVMPISENLAPISDLQVLNQLHAMNQSEIATARMVLDKSESAPVRAFATRMIHDHTLAEEKVAALARAKGLGLDGGSGRVDPALYELRGGPFARAYIDSMVGGHEDALAFLAHAYDQNSDPAIRQLVLELRPTVSRHEELARELQRARPIFGS
jgi:putative membrane protein